MFFQKLGMIMNQQYCKNNVKNFLESDNLEKVEDLIEKLSCTVFCAKFVLYKSEAGITLLYLSTKQSFSILFSINIDKDLHVQMYHEKKFIPPSCYLIFCLLRKLRYFLK